METCACGEPLTLLIRHAGDWLDMGPIAARGNPLVDGAAALALGVTEAMLVCVPCDAVHAHAAAGDAW